MKILVTGSSGFIGNHLIQKLTHGIAPNYSPSNKVIVGISRKARSYPWEVDTETTVPQLINCDLTLEGQVASLMLRYQPDVIFHLAGDPMTSNWRLSTSHSNYLSTHHLLQHAKPGTRFILASSCAVYGNSEEPVSENDLLYPSSAYGAAKSGAENLLYAYTESKNISGISIRLAATVGAGATHGLIPDLIKKVKSDTATLNLLGNYPGSIKPYTHVSDVADGLVQLGLDPCHQLVGPVNLALNDNLCVSDIAMIVMKELGVRKTINWGGSETVWKGDSQILKVDNTLAIGLGWQPKYPTSHKAVLQAVKDIVG